MESKLGMEWWGGENLHRNVKRTFLKPSAKNYLKRKAVTFVKATSENVD